MAVVPSRSPPPSLSKPRGDGLLHQLNGQGYIQLEKAGEASLHDIIAEFGEVIQVADVRNNPNTRAMVTSAQAMDFHTDHRKADYVAWLCVEQDDSGGESILADAEMAFERLSSAEQESLSNIRLFEHRVFPSDEESCPLVSLDHDGNRKFYYASWLADDNLPADQNAALQNFSKAVHQSQVAEFKLQRNDVLIVDNTWILHGRRSYTDEKRHLKLYWIRHSLSPSIQGEQLP